MVCRVWMVGMFCDLIRVVCIVIVFLYWLLKLCKMVLVFGKVNLVLDRV